MTYEHEYVLGFAFDRLAGEVCLIHKLRPEWQCGKLNGVGGSLNIMERSLPAMRREFREETGVDIEESRWRIFGVLDTLRPGEARIWLYTTDLKPGEWPEMCEDEEVIMLPLAHLHDLDPADIHDNLSWMIPMALAESSVFAEIREV